MAVSCSIEKNKCVQDIFWLDGGGFSRPEQGTHLAAGWRSEKSLRSVFPWIEAYALIHPSGPGISRRPL